MHQISIKKIVISVLCLFTIIGLFGCDNKEPYLIKDYLFELALKSQICTEDSDLNSIYDSLANWNVITNEDLKKLDKQLDYAFMLRSVVNLTGKAEDYLLDNKILNSHKTNDYIYKDEAYQTINKAVEYINNKVFVPTYEYQLKENEDIYFDESDDSYKYVDTNKDASFEDVYSYFDISNTYEVDFDDAQIIPLNNEEDTGYQNNKFNLLSSSNHVFNVDGFRVSYTINGSGIDIHVSKLQQGIRVFADLAINKIKPSFKWKYDEGELKDCYFNVSLNSCEQIGASFGRYGNYYLSFKDLDESSFINKLKSTIKPRTDDVDMVIPICEIKTPIPNVPTATINFKVLIKLYVSGKIELVLYNTHMAGFETNNGNIRFFYDHDDDFDGLIKSSGKAAFGLNVSIDATNFKLFDIELDAGLKALVGSTIHLYDSDGNINSESSDIAYSILDEVSKENPNVLICGDLSLYWLMDLLINTSKTVMYKMGFSKVFHILDEDNQVFDNMHHIENGQFVPKCTRKGKNIITNATIEVNHADKIVLNTYAEVISVNESFDISVETLPDGYSINDIKFESLNSKIASINNMKVTGISSGCTKIKAYIENTDYSAYINVLVSTG